MNLRNNLYAFLLLTLFVSYNACVRVFTHTHSIDSKIIIHSHFAKEKKSSSSGNHLPHTHSGNECLFLAYLSNLIVTEFHVDYQIHPYLHTTYVLLAGVILPDRQLESVAVCLLRAPPVI